MRSLTELVHAEGGKIVAQLNHAGRQLIPRAIGVPRAVSASSVYEWSLGTWPRKLEEREIGEIVAAFAAAAVRCQRAGFDGVQLQAAHGYLLHEFLSAATNEQEDEYGGPLENRANMLLEVVRAVRARLGERVPLAVRLSAVDLVEGGR